MVVIITWGWNRDGAEVTGNPRGTSPGRGWEDDEARSECWKNCKNGFQLLLKEGRASAGVKKGGGVVLPETESNRKEQVPSSSSRLSVSLTWPPLAAPHGAAGKAEIGFAESQLRHHKAGLELRYKSLSIGTGRSCYYSHCTDGETEHRAVKELAQGEMT